MRRWLAYRHLWHEALDLPPTVRWLARDRLPWSWKKTEATGAIMVRLDPFRPPGPTAIPCGRSAHIRGRRGRSSDRIRRRAR